MAFQTLGAVGVHCPLHGDRLTGITPEVSSHKVIVCDLCGEMIKTPGCRTCDWVEGRLQRKCSRCGRHFCEDCGRRASTGGYHSVELCRDCDAERLAEEQEAHDDYEGMDSDAVDEDPNWEEEDDFKDEEDDEQEECEDGEEDEDDEDDGEEDRIRHDVWRQVIRMSRLRR